MNATLLQMCKVVGRSKLTKIHMVQRLSKSLKFFVKIGNIFYISEKMKRNPPIGL